MGLSPAALSPAPPAQTRVSQPSVKRTAPRNLAIGYLRALITVLVLQYALLHAHLPAEAKGSIVFAGTLVLSWIVIAAIRRIPFVRQAI